MLAKYKEWGDPFNLSEFKRRNAEREIETILREIENYINKHTNSVEYNTRYGSIWVRKMWNYLAFVINGGYTNNRLTIDEMIKTYKDCMNSGILTQINNLLNIKITNHKGEPLDARLSVLLTQGSEVKTVEFNEEVLLSLIKNELLMKAQGIENDNIYASLLKFLVEFCPNLKLLGK